MMSIKRYDPVYYPSKNAEIMEEMSDGDYVLFDDHEDKLLDKQFELDELQRKYDNLIEKIGEIWREG